jgi:hypothetical protein
MSGTVPIPAGGHGKSPDRKTEVGQSNPMISFVFNKIVSGKPIQSQRRGADVAARPLVRPDLRHICVAGTDSPAARTNDDNEVPAEIGRMQLGQGAARAGFGEPVPAAFSFLIEWIEEAPTT